MWELGKNESWAPKNWCFWTVVLEKTLESPLDCKEIKPVHPKGNQPWIFIGRTDAEVEAPIFDHLMQRTDSLEKTLILGKIERRRRRAWQRMRWLDGITDLKDMSLSRPGSWQWTGRPGSSPHGIAKSWTWLSEWTELNWNKCLLSIQILVSWRTRKKWKEAPFTVLFRVMDSGVLCGIIVLIECSKEAWICTRKVGIDPF